MIDWIGDLCPNEKFCGIAPVLLNRAVNALMSGRWSWYATQFAETSGSVNRLELEADEVNEKAANSCFSLYHIRPRGSLDKVAEIEKIKLG